MKTLLILVAMIVVSPAAFANGYLVPLGSGVTIQKIHAHENGGFTMWVNPASVSNPDNCGDTTLLHVPASTPGHDTMLSVALAAYMSGRKVGMWSRYGCAIIPFWGGSTTRPQVSDLWITD